MSIKLSEKAPEALCQLSSSRLVLILGALAAMGPLSIDMYLPAMPSMALSLATPLSGVEASLAAYFAGLSLGQLFYGPLSDRYGRKGLIVFGLALYTLASIACAAAQSIEAIIAFRFVQALGACAGMVIARAVVRDRYTHQESARIFSLLMLVMGVAPILAPLLGGYIATHIDWRAIFWILVLYGASCMAMVAFFLPETHGKDPTVQLRQSFSTFATLLKDREFMRYGLSGSIAQAGLFAYITSAPYVFIEYFGIPAERFGFVFGVNALGLIAMSQLNTRLLRRFSFEAILRKNFGVLAAAGLLLLLAGVTDAGFWAVAVPLFVYISLLGTTFPNSTAGALALQGRQAGSASALLGTIQMLSAALASTVVSHLHATSAAVMSLVIAGCGLTAALLFTLLTKVGRNALKAAA